MAISCSRHFQPPATVRNAGRSPARVYLYPLGASWSDMDGVQAPLRCPNNRSQLSDFGRPVSFQQGRTLFRTDTGSSYGRASLSGTIFQRTLSYGVVDTIDHFARYPMGPAVAWEEHRKARERKRRAECDDPRVAVGPSVSSECGARAPAEKCKAMRYGVHCGGVLAPGRGVRAGTDAGRTWAAKGHGRRLIFCETRNRTDPISGFAKNGDAPDGRRGRLPSCAPMVRNRPLLTEFDRHIPLHLGPGWRLRLWIARPSEGRGSRSPVNTRFGVVFLGW